MRSDNETPTTFITCDLITRWSTWLEFAIYCFKNFEVMEHFIDEHLDINESGANEESKHLVKSDKLQNELVFFQEFSNIIAVLKILQGRLPLTESVVLVENFRRNLPVPYYGKIRICSSPKPRLWTNLHN